MHCFVRDATDGLNQPAQTPPASFAGSARQGRCRKLIGVGHRVAPPQFPSGLAYRLRRCQMVVRHMRPDEVVKRLLQADGRLCARTLLDASIRLPRRTDRKPVLAVATKPRKPTMRVRPGSAERELGLLTQREVAVILRISERAVRAIEKRAFDKIRRQLTDFWREWTGSEIEETTLLVDWSDRPLTGAEIAAVYDLARGTAERQALRKLFALARGQNLSIRP